MSKFILRLGIILFGGLSVPLCSFLIIFLCTIAIVIAIAKCALCLCKSLFCGFPVPFYRFCFIFIHAPAVIVTVTPFILSLHVSLFCDFPIPHCSFLNFLIGIIHNTITEQIFCQLQHCRFISVFYSFSVPFCGLIFIIIIALAHLVLRLRITLLCGLAVQLYSLFLVLADAVSGFIALAQFTLRFRAVLLSRFCIPRYSRLIVREFRIQPPGHILGRHISLSCRRFVPSAGLFFIFFNTERLIIALAQCALRLRITLLGSFFIPHNGIFRILCYTNTVLVTPCHFQLRLWVSVITGRNHVALKRHLGIADLLKITGILQVVLLGFLLRFLLRFLTQTKVLHEAHEFSLFIFRPIEQEAVHGIFLIAETHSLDLSPQTVPIHTASRRFKPFFNRFCLDGIRDFHVMPTHTDRLQFICKTYFHLNFAHDDSLPMYL